MGLYDYEATAENVLLQKNGGPLSNLDDGILIIKLKTDEEKLKVANSNNVGDYIYLSDKYYQIDEVIILEE